MASLETARGRIGFAEQGGGGDAVPILFLHGVGSDKNVWRPQLDFFGRTRRALAFDYPGYGESDPAAPDCTRDDYAEAILAGLDALQVERAHVCGLSLGGVVAIALHSAAPDRCASLILADTFAVHPEGEAIYARSVQASRDPGMRTLAEQRAPLLLAAGTPDEIRSLVIDTMAGLDPEAFRIGARAVWLADQRERVSAIRTPTLVLVGELDPVTPPALSEALAEQISNAEFHLIPGASHIANLDTPREFNRRVEDFLSQAEAQG